jgi:flagellar hook-basal body complex protein FliE
VRIGAKSDNKSLGAFNETAMDPGKSFSDYLRNSIGEVNELQKVADTKTTEVSTGKSGNIHEAMLASTYAQLSFNLMVQIRNKALEAYQEVMRMPV